MYRQIYRNKILYYLATQRFNSPKKPCKNPQFSDTPTLPGGGTHPFVRRDSTFLSASYPFFWGLPLLRRDGQYFLTDPTLRPSGCSY